MFAGLAHFSVRKISRNGPPPQACQLPDNWLSRRRPCEEAVVTESSRFCQFYKCPRLPAAQQPVSTPGILHNDWALGDKGWFIELARPALYALYGELIIRGNFAQI